MEQEQLGWEVLFNSWINRLPIDYKTEEYLGLYIPLKDNLLPQLINFVFSEDYPMKLIHSSSPLWMLSNFLKLFESILFENMTRKDIDRNAEEKLNKERLRKEYERLEGKKAKNIEEEAPKKMLRMEKCRIVASFIFSLVWSFGVFIHQNQRDKFNDFLFNLIEDMKAKQVMSVLREMKENNFPNSKTQNLFSIYYTKVKCMWVPWQDKVDQMDHCIAKIYEDIYVPTEETVRYSYLLKQLSLHSFPVLFLGETGTSKTVTIKQFMNKLDCEKWLKILLIFSARTSANTAQDIIDSKIEKLKKGEYGPPIGKQALVFIDDLNMPTKDIYGAQGPIELIRQLLDSGGWYDRRTNDSKCLIRIQINAAMGMPGGGKTFLSMRLLHHFNLIYLSNFSESNLSLIFRTITNSGLSTIFDLSKQSQNITKLTISLYTELTKTLLPLPSKPHYTYNLRDIKKCIQGLLSIPEPVYAQTSSKITLLYRAWIHESMRIFHDRLINTHDAAVFNQILGSVCADSTYRFNWETLAIDDIMFGDLFMLEIRGEGVEGEEEVEKRRVYQEMTFESVVQSVQESMFLYNHSFKTNMNLVFFKSALHHVVRICRIIRVTNGNALLMGIGGNGRKTLTKLASFICDFETFGVEIHKNFNRGDWNESMKTLFKKVGLDKKNTLFLFSDSQIREESFIEDINNILNSGEVPNLFLPEEKEEIINEMRYQYKKIENPYEQFEKNVKQFLRIVLFMSPVGDSFRN
jgi:dynein heavy chain, axonemal